MFSHSFEANLLRDMRGDVLVDMRGDKEAATALWVMSRVTEVFHPNDPQVHILAAEYMLDVWKEPN